MRRVLFISSSRADYGLLREVILQTQKLNKETYLLVTGSHLSKDYGYTINEIKRDKIKNIIRKKFLEKKFKDKDIIGYFNKSMKITSEVILKIKPDCIVILGDRYELLASSISAMICGVPIVHIHGGEITKGAYDDSIRHAISKLSYLHFPVHDKYKNRLIQMGENPKMVYNYGGLGAYSISKQLFFTQLELEKILNIKFKKKFILVTFHPVTLEKNQVKHQIRNLINFLDNLDNVSIIITSPNIDTDSDILKKEILKFVKLRKNVFFFNSLGSQIYLSLMKLSFLVIGNSSSGVLETPSFGVRTINIGSRQEGRITPSNVVNCDYSFNSINRAFKKIMKKKKQKSNIFFRKNTPAKIAKKILTFNLELKKDFYDL
mgnify:CR=1 FL=1